MAAGEAKSVCLITGASAGIGAALARCFAEEGFNLALLARRTDRLEALSAELTAKHGVQCVALRCDVTRDGEVESAIQQTLMALGRLDVVIANAGFGVSGELEKLTVDDYRRQFETNVFGLLRTAKAAIEPLKQSRGGLVLMGSVAGHVALPGVSAYSMSKFAVRALAEALRGELAAAGVSVTLISPGYVESEFRAVDNHGKFDASVLDEAPRWIVMPTRTAAREMTRAILKRRAEAVITLHGKVAVFLSRHFPGVMGFVLRRVRRKRR